MMMMMMMIRIDPENLKKINVRSPEKMRDFFL
jgi:hypothetical protein